MQPFLILLNNVTPTLDSAGNLVFSPTQTNTSPPPTNPVNTLEQTYFSEDDLIGDCVAKDIKQKVTTNNNGNVHVVWYGLQPPIEFHVTATGTLVQVSTSSNPIPPPDSSPPLIPPVIVDGQTIDRPWPTSGQARKDVLMSGPASTKFVTRIPTNLVPKPNQLGFCRFTEYPGAPFQARQVVVFVNGAAVFDTGLNGDTSPGINWCLGNPQGYRNVGGQFNAQPGDLLEVVCRAYNAATGENSSFLYDFATPLRY